MNTQRKTSTSLKAAFAGLGMLGLAGCVSAPSGGYYAPQQPYSGGGYDTGYGQQGGYRQGGSSIEVETSRSAYDVCVPGTMRVYDRQETFDRDASGNFIYDSYGRRRYTAVTTYTCQNRNTYQPYYY